MRRPRTTGSLLILGLLSPGLFWAQAGGPQGSSRYRWAGSADWEYYESAGDLQGRESTFTSLRQKYSLDLSGFLWDPRFSAFSLGLDLIRTDRDNDGVRLDSDGLGYRAQSTFFLNRPFPLRLYARRSTTEVAGIALANNDRETGAWGAEWNLTTPGSQKIRLFFDRTSFDLLSPLALQERKKTGSFDFSKQLRRSNLTFRYNLHDQKERINGTDFNRHFFTFTDRTQFRNGATWSLNSSYIESDARFSSGQTDDLATSRLATRFDLPQREKIRLGFSYDFNNNDGRFVNSTSHIAKTDGRFQLSPRWESTGNLTLGRIESSSTTTDIEESLAGVRTGLRFHQEWNRLTLIAAYSLGFDEARFQAGADRQTLNQFAELVLMVPLNGSDELFASLSQNRDDYDTAGIGFSRDEFRARLGWKGGIGETGRGRATAMFRDFNYDTFQFGLQESQEISLQTSLTYPDGGISLSLSSSEGITDFFPDPTGTSPFLPGTDLVSEADVASAGVHWRLLRNVRFRLQARLENRDFTTIGKEDIFSYHPQIDYNLNTWQFSLGYSHYERRNGTEFTDDTLLLKVAKRFF